MLDRVSPVDVAIQSVRGAVRSFHPNAMPQLSRGHYRRELTVSALLPVMMGVVEGTVVGVMVRNAFDGSVPDKGLNFAVAVLAGAPAFANVTSFIWSAIGHGQHKIRVLVALKIAAAILIALVAVAPRSPAGLLLLTASVVGARACWAGVVTIRSTVWRANYPRNARAKMAGKFATVQSLLLAATGYLLAEAMSWHEEAFRLLYPLAAAFGIAGAMVYRKMRVRGHRALLIAERRESGSRSLVSPLQLWRILRDDRNYRHYMACMFLFGTGNMMTAAPLVIMLREVFDMGYRRGMLVSSVIPIALTPLTIPIWSRLLDNVHIIKFRAIHSWAFVCAATTMLVAVVSEQWQWFILSASLQGVAFGGGMLAWNLGHHDFAPAHKASQYMGVHVTLTGMRGMLAPLLAVGLYEWLNTLEPGAGAWVFAFCVLLNMSGAIGFGLMHKRMVGPGHKADLSDAGPPLQPPAAG